CQQLRQRQARICSTDHQRRLRVRDSRTPLRVPLIGALRIPDQLDQTLRLIAGHGERTGHHVVGAQVGLVPEDVSTQPTRTATVSVPTRSIGARVLATGTVAGSSEAVVYRHETNVRYCGPPTKHLVRRVPRPFPLVDRCSLAVTSIAPTSDIRSRRGLDSDAASRWMLI